MLRPNYFWLLIISSVHTSNIISVDKLLSPTRYCREKDRLITSEENDEYLLINAEIDTIIVMECRFCNDKEQQEPKIWYYQDRYRENAEKEVELGMDNNSSYNRIYTTPDLSLAIKDFAITDAGIYLCHGVEGQEIEKKFNYRLEPVIKETGSQHREEGNITEWEAYRENYLASIATRFAVSQMTELAEIREVGITLQVVSEWTPWGPCENCIRNRGYRTSVGVCQLTRFINTTIANGSDSSIVKFFRRTPSLPCKSMLLEEEFPTVSTALRYLPDFLLKERCKKCPHVRKVKGRAYKYVKRYVLGEGAYLTVVCPESTFDMQITWKKDAITLEKGVRRSFRKLDPEARIIVDAFGTLYLLDISVHEEGNYTCYVNNVNMMTLKLVVISRTKLLTDEFLRHLGYLGFILLLCSFCYCSGLIYTCKRRDKFIVMDSKRVTVKEEENEPLMIDNE